ncbi:cytidine deaminase-like fold-containing protein, partial [Pseudomonas aeruginosa]
QGTRVDAGGDLAINAGQDLRLIASQASAGDEAYLVAGDKLELLAANDSNYYLYDKKKKGDFGRKETRRDEVTDVKAVGSQISSGGDLTLLSGGDQTYQGAKLESGNDLAIVSGGAVTFEAVKDLHQESHEKSKGDLAWNSAKGKGQTDETLRQTQIVAQGNLAIKAADGLKIDVKHIDQKTVSETIDVMVKADPSLAWLREAEKQGDVDWRKVREVHDSFKYSHSGLGAGAALAIAIVVTYLTWGAGSSMAGVAAKSATGVAANSVASAVATNAAISTVNNRGNLGAVAKDVSSSDSLKGYAVAGISGGFMPSSLGAQLAVRSALNTVVNGGKFRDNVAQAAISMAADALSGAIFDKVGDALVGSGLPKKVAVHAIVGGLIGEAAGGDFRTAALAAGANEALVSLVGEKIFPGEAHERVLAMTSQLIGMTVAAAAGGDTKAQEKAAWVAQQATVYNNLNHAAAESLLKEIKDCRAAGGCGEEKLQGILGKYEKLSAERSNAIGQCASRQCVDDIVDSSIRMDDPVSKELLSLLRQTTYDTPGLLQGNPDAVVSQTPNPSGWGDLFALDKQLAFAKNLKEGWLTPEETADLDRWNASTSWLDRTAGRQLDPKEKAYLLSELGGAAAMALLGGRGSVGAGAKGATPVVTAEGRIGNSVFTDVNQTARPAAQANPNQPTLIADRVDAKIAAKGTPHPNGNMADAHAEIGVIQKAFNEGKTVGSDMTMNVVGKDVCGYCRGDIAAAASKSGLKSLTIQAKDDITGLPKTYYWEVGMKSIREKKI